MKASTAKYLFLTKTYLKSYLRYPMNIFVKLIYLPVQMLMYVFLWLNISRGSDVDYKYLICYYLITALLGYAYPFRHVAVDIQTDVLDGGVANYLVRPVAYIVPAISKYCAWMCVYSVVFIPAVVFTALYRAVSIRQLLCFVLLAVLGMLVQFFLWYAIGLTSFFTEKITGIMLLISALSAFASGSIIPLFYFGQGVESITRFLPFRYYIYVPVNALLGTPSVPELLTDIAGSVCWILVLVFASGLMWSRGVRKLQMNIS